MRIRVGLVLVTAGMIISASGVRAGPMTLMVCPSCTYTTIKAATTAANLDTDLSNTYDIQVAPGTYTNDFSSITRPMTIQTTTPGSQVVLSATIPPPDLKGIFTTTSSLTVKGLTFQGAAIADSDGGNAAGIRDQSTGATSLIVEDSIFRSNQNGILTAGSNNQEIVQILNSQFFNNGNKGQEHALYVGDALSLLVDNSLFCGTAVGHDIKSRAKSTTVTNSQIFVGTNTGAPAGCDVGSTSFGIDAPNGGELTISGDQIIQGDANQNGAMVSYGSEGLLYAANSFVVSDTSFTNLGVRSSTGIQQFANGGRGCAAPVQFSNTTFTNVNTEVNPAGCVATSPTTPTTVPEPQNLWLLLTALGCGGVMLSARWRRSASPELGHCPISS